MNIVPTKPSPSTPWPTELTAPVYAELQLESTGQRARGQGNE